ncbi:hypothetical protein C2E25_14330 [Geothermobacter hydrogeniphilus]|uniref:Thiamine-binding protein domain-containing protein n=1 Tax=Geothermobacter hydrogeniphilus TaxID=1969733 RepID=A0A2K2H754_9BACT|nr:MTH1187 family thiamine-binding protein [Geothermobacter hydrogeniphilus]PNU19053.1 hypothetical protein C2E25_14330 [Geothermobacter hydrogeniphilus]
MAIVEVSIAPLGTAHPSVSAYVAACLRILRDSGLKHQLNPMGTVIEGDLDAILAVIARMHEAPFAKGASRVSTLIKIDDRRDSESHSMQGKVAVVTKLLDDS